MNMALQSTPPREVEDGAWILTQMAHLKLSVGKTDEAETLLTQALAMFPAYHYALGNLAKVRIQQARYDDAVELLKQRYETAPHAENLYDLAQALKLSGRGQEASKAFSDFEQKSLLETNRADNSNHELIFYYADEAQQPAKALEVAKREFVRWHDVYTLDAYAWALYVNAQYAAGGQGNRSRAGAGRARCQTASSCRRDRVEGWRPRRCGALSAAIGGAECCRLGAGQVAFEHSRAQHCRTIGGVRDAK